MTHGLRLGAHPLDEFLESTWRRRPVLMRGAAAHTVPSVLDRARFDAAAERVAAARPDRVSRSEDGTVFVQELDAGDDELQSIAAAFASATTCRRVWFDGVFATAGHGIGSHYDVSDNFVIQQSGHKRWRLHDPGVIAPSELRDRILGTPGVGTVPMPASALEFDVGPGDMLYIPALWPHWGVSEDDSISVSLVFNAQTALDALVDRIRTSLAARPAFWHLAPVQARPTAAPDEPEGLSPGAAREIVAALERHLPVDGRIDPARYDTRSPRVAATLPTPPDLEAPDALPLPGEELHRLFKTPLPALDAGACLFPDAATGELLRAYAGRIYLKKVLQLGRAALPRIDDVAIAASLATAVERLLAMAAPRVWNAVLRPEVTCWVHVMHRALDAGYAPRIAEVAGVLPRLLAGSLLAAGALRDGDRLRLALPRPGMVRLAPLGIAGHLPDADAGAEAAWLTVCTEAGVARWRVTGPSGAPLMGPAPRRDGTAGWTTAPRVEPGGLALVWGDAWIEAHYPRGADARAEPLWTDLGPDDKAALAEAVGDGMTILRDRAPDAFGEVMRTIDVLVPVRGRGLDPLNESVHAMRGLVAISARPDYLAAQSLVHETAHNRLSSLLDVHRLIENPDHERHRSPFTGSDRPLVNLLHGVVSFVQELALDARLRGHVREHPGWELATYDATLVARIDEALTTIRRHAQLTEPGHALVARCVRALDEYRTPRATPTVTETARPNAAASLGATA